MMLIDNNTQVAVCYTDEGDKAALQQLANQLGLRFYHSLAAQPTEAFLLTYRDNCLKLLDKQLLKKGGLMVEIEPRAGEQRSFPAPKQGALAQALGKSKTVVDATTGWGQDSLYMFRMGYQMQCIERSPVMAALLHDGFNRLAQCAWVQSLNLAVPQLLVGDAIAILTGLTTKPDCIYLDPMFPPKPKKSALAKKPLQILHDLVGYDTDKEQLFNCALQATGKRVIVKSPDYAKPLGEKPSESFQGKLVRYDVYQV